MDDKLFDDIEIAPPSFRASWRIVVAPGVLTELVLVMRSGSSMNWPIAALEFNFTKTPFYCDKYHMASVGELMYS